MKDKEKQEKVFDILNKFEFFQGQRAGRELWLDKPKEVQDKDIADFIKDINYIRSYLQDSVVLSKEEYKQLEEKIMDLRLDKQELKNEISEKDNKIALLEETIECIKFNVDFARKETAEKILDLLVLDCKACDENWHSGCLCLRATLAGRKIAKHFGLEIKE